nr:EOG090X08PA [Sida crystallina]
MPVRRSHWLMMMTLTFLLISHVVQSGMHQHADIEDNEFAEFETEDFEVEEENVGEPIHSEPQTDGSQKLFEQVKGVGNENDEDEATVETEDNEFEHVDEDEFEGYDGSRPKGEQSNEGPKITFAKLPAHLRSNWESYLLELAILAGLTIYFINFFIGRAKNQKIADTWYTTFKGILQDNFSLVGDDGKLENSQPGLIKESENVYLLWCSGRTCCEGVMFELRLVKRQDLVSMVIGLFRPQSDQVHVKAFLNPDDMDSFVMCLANKKLASKLAKDMSDLSVFCPERKSTEKYSLPSNFVLMSEIGEAASALLDVRVCALISKIPEVFESMHVSDQYSGVKQPEDSAPTKMPETKKMIIFTFNLAFKNGKSIADVVENTRPAFYLVFYTLERVKRFRLSKECKAKAEKNRLKVEEAFLKSTHAARAEAAAARREEKRRLEKEKILQEDDPEKQRKWEEKEAKRQAKKRMPKMKAIKV